MEFQPKDKCREPGKKQETCFAVKLQCAEIGKRCMEFPNIPNYILHGYVQIWAVMSNTVDMTQVEKYFSQLVRADKLSRLDRRSCRVETASH